MKRPRFDGAPDLRNGDGVVPKKPAIGKPVARRHSSEEEIAAVRMMRTLRAELAATYGTVQRIVVELGCEVEPVRMWVKAGRHRGPCHRRHEQ